MDWLRIDSIIDLFKRARNKTSNNDQNQTENSSDSNETIAPQQQQQRSHLLVFIDGIKSILMPFVFSFVPPIHNNQHQLMEDAEVQPLQAERGVGPF